MNTIRLACILFTALTLVLYGSDLLMAAEPDADVALVKQILSSNEGVDRAALAASISDAGLRDRLRKILPQIDEAAAYHRRTQQLLADVKAVGGTVQLAPGGPDWLREASGDDAMRLFEVPVSVSLYDGNNPLKGKGGLNTEVNDAWLDKLRGFTTVKSLDLANCDVHRAGLKHVATLSRLESLNLTLSPVTDDDLPPLAALTELKQLSLASTPCTGEGFQHLKALSKLENLNMHHAEANDAGLAAIAEVGDLERLWIAHTHFTDAGAKHLAAHKHLKRLGIGSKSAAASGAAIAAVVDLPLTELELFDRQATDEAIAHAARIPTLRLLNIAYGPNVTDASMDAIAGMPAVEELRIYGAKITDDGVAKLAGVKSLRKIVLMRLENVSDAAIERLRKDRPDVTIQ